MALLHFLPRAGEAIITAAGTHEEAQETPASGVYLVAISLWHRRAAADRCYRSADRCYLEVDTADEPLGAAATPRRAAHRCC